MTLSAVTLEKITENVGVYISKEHRFGTDAVLLADFCAPKPSDTAIDLCTGTGIIPLRWIAQNTSPKHTIGVEITDSAFQLAQKSAEEFGQGKFTVVNRDLRGFSLEKGEKEVTLVSCNPPYFKQGSGAQRGGAELMARCEEACTLDDVAKAAFRLLKYGGRLCICHRPDRLCDIFEAFRANRIEPKKLQIVAAGKENRPFLVLVEGKKGANPGIIVLPEIKI